MPLTAGGDEDCEDDDEDSNTAELGAVAKKSKKRRGQKKKKKKSKAVGADAEVADSAADAVVVAENSTAEVEAAPQAVAVVPGATDVEDDEFVDASSGGEDDSAPPMQQQQQSQQQPQQGASASTVAALSDKSPCAIVSADGVLAAHFAPEACAGSACLPPPGGEPLGQPASLLQGPCVSACLDKHEVKGEDKGAKYVGGSWTPSGTTGAPCVYVFGGGDGEGCGSSSQGAAAGQGGLSSSRAAVVHCFRVKKPLTTLSEASVSEHHACAVMCHTAVAVPFSAFGIFDGHGGKPAATFASKDLLPMVMRLAERALIPGDEPAPAAVAGADGKASETWGVQVSDADRAAWAAQDGLVERLPKACLRSLPAGYPAPPTPSAACLLTANCSVASCALYALSPGRPAPLPHPTPLHRRCLPGSWRRTRCVAPGTVPVVRLPRLPL